MASREEILDLLCKDLLASVEHFYGPDGLRKVVEQMKRLNRRRYDRAEIDALESMLTGTR